MESVDKFIVVNAPAGCAYQLWADFENFPKFMKSLREVRRIDEKRYYIRSERRGTEYGIIVEISLQIPGRRIAWRTTSGEESSGVVSFEAEADGRTKVLFEMLYDSRAGWRDTVALSERLQSNLENFKKLIETGNC
jgi:uncharacterized membrane protein